MTLPIFKKAATSHWRQIQRENFTCAQKLADFLHLNEENRNLLASSPRFKLNLPRRLAAKMAKNDLSDPLFRQFVPLIEEEMEKEGYTAEPLCDTSFQKEKKLLHKYHGRVLLVATSACAMHCRFCFRQNFPYETQSIGFTSEIDYIRQHPEITEVILSGGDPLSLSDDTLSLLLSALGEISHVKRIRFHTRFPIGIPERIDESFLTLLSRCVKQLYFIIHCNHPLELDEEVIDSLRKIASLGIPLLNQSVLLKGVNDDEKTFLALCEALTNAGVIPYYLHLHDRVKGTSHFEVPDERGRELIRYVQQHLSGYGVPRLVREEPGASSKTYI
jgi:EF-P beta-lysylation protein EpmB